MAKKFLTPINVVNLGSDPGSASEGDLYYNTVSDILRIYANGSWSDVAGGGGGGGVTSITGTASEIEVSASTGAVTISLPTTINANTTGSAATLTTARTIALSGDLSGSASFDGSASVSINATIQANSVALGTDTSGNYVATASGGTGISVSGSGSENAAITITNDGVTSLSGTSNQISVSASTGNITISIPSTFTFPGTVTLNADPTQSLQAATKQYVDNISINTQTSSYILALSDAGKVIEMNSASANNLTIPLNSTIAFPIGTTVDIIQYGSGQTTLVAESGVTLRSKGGNLKLTGQYSGATLYKRDTNEWVVIGDLTS